MNFVIRSSSIYERIFIINLVIDFMEDDPYYKAFVRPTDNLPPQIKMNSSELKDEKMPRPRPKPKPKPKPTIDENLRPIFIDGSNVARQ